MFGKTIELFLADGSTDGIVSAELCNWNGHAIKVPRSELSSNSPALAGIDGAGVYFLFCEDDATGADSVYIGEAENVFDRLNGHINFYKSGKEKFYWHTAVAFLGGDLNKAHIRFMENELVSAVAANGFKVLTKNTFKKTVLKMAQKAAALEFIENIKIIIGVLGFSVLRDVGRTKPDVICLSCKGKDADARGFVSVSGFVVLKGSVVSAHVTPALSQQASYAELRLSLERNGSIKDGVFQKDFEFHSPSAAASVIKGYPCNGNDVWKTEDGVKLGAL